MAEWIQGEGGLWACKGGDVVYRPRPLEYGIDVKQVDVEHRVLRFTISTQKPDRENDRVIQRGMDTSFFARNPVVLFGHESWGLPVARSIKVKKEGKGDDSFTWSDAMFAGEEQGHDHAQLVYALARDGFLNTASIGARFHERKELPEADRMPGWYPGYEITRSELMEWSVVGIPANVGAEIHRGLPRSKGWDVDRVREVARRCVQGSDLDRFIRALTGEETIEVRHAEPPAAPARLSDDDVGFDHWQKWCNRAAPRRDEIEKAARTDAEPSTESVPAPTPAQEAVIDLTIDTTKAEAAIDAISERVKSLDAELAAVEARAAREPQAAAPSSVDVESLKSWISEQLAEQRKHFDHALADLWSDTERTKAAAVRAARSTKPSDTAAVPVSAAEGKSPPSSSRSAQPMDAGVIVKAFEAGRQIARERRLGVIR